MPGFCRACEQLLKFYAFKAFLKTQQLRIPVIVITLIAVGSL